MHETQLMQYRINHPLPFHLLRLCRMFYHSLSVDFKDGKEDKPLSRPEAITRAVCSVVVLVAGIAVIILAALF